MAVIPISGQPVQYNDILNAPASGFYLKMYAFNTTDPINMYTDSTGVTTLDKCVLNLSGYPTTDGNSVFIPHSDQPYDLALYANAADADADATSNAEWIVSGILQFQTVGTDSWSLYNNVPTQTSGTTFTVTGDQRTIFSVGTRLRFTDISTLYGIVKSVVYGVVTTVTVTLDSGVLTSSLSAVYTSIGTATNKDFTASAISYLNTDLTLYKIYELETLLNELPISLKIAGALIDGSSDDYATVQALFDAAGSKSYYLPKGTMITSSLLRIPSGAKLEGCGYDSVVKADGASTFVGSWSGDTSAAGIITLYQNTGTVLRNFRIEGNKATKADSQAHGIHVMGCYNVKIDDVWINNIASDNASLANGGDGILVDADSANNPSKRINIYSIFSTGNARNGIKLVSCSRVTIDNPNIYDIDKEGVLIAPKTGATVSYVTINEVQIENSNYGVFVGGIGTTLSVNINGGHINDCAVSGISLDEVSGGTRPNIVNIKGTNLYNNNTSGGTLGDINIDYADNVNIVGVNSLNGGSEGLKITAASTCKVTGSTFSNHQKNGIHLDPANFAVGQKCRDITITDNTTVDNGQAGGASTTTNGINISTSGANTITNLTVADNITSSPGATQTHGVWVNGSSQPFPITGAETWRIHNNQLIDDTEIRNQVPLTISAGDLDINGIAYLGNPPLITVNAETGSSDTLDSISGGNFGDTIRLKTDDAIFISNAGNIQPESTPYTIGVTGNITLIKIANGDWVQVSAEQTLV